MGWKRSGLMRRPAAGGEARERASFFHFLYVASLRDASFLKAPGKCIQYQALYLHSKGGAISRFFGPSPVIL